MFSNLSADTQDKTPDYPINDSNLPFSDYIQRCEALITERRTDLTNPDLAAKTIQANIPFEYRPTTNSPKVGVLLIHGLLDSPFTHREIGSHLQAAGLLTRSILLPGHGTRPDDLLHVTYHDWIQAVRYGIESLKNEVDSIFLIGYSTGAALSIYHALHDSRITGIILLSPAIKLRTPVDIVTNWIRITHYLSKDRDWVFQNDETDYAKYRSVTFNSVKQVSKLTEAIREMGREHAVKQPMYMILSREDETISSSDAVEFFSAMPEMNSRLLLYTSTPQTYADARIETRDGQYPELKISHLSHVSIPFSATNIHYGKQGDFMDASHPDQNRYVDGAYNRIEINTYEALVKYGLAEHPRRILTYNPDFKNMVDSIIHFIDKNKLP
jgi:esterase/lipase